MRILFDHNVPVGVRAFLPIHDVRTIVEMDWSLQMENGELIKAAEAAHFDVLITSDQNIRHQRSAKARSKIAFVVLGSNIWPIVRHYAAEIAARVAVVKPGDYEFIEMPLDPKPSRS